MRIDMFSKAEIDATNSTTHLVKNQYKNKVIDEFFNKILWN